MKRVDVVIVGASLAGSACLRQLSRLGIEAVAFERAQFPREKVCGGFLSPGAVQALDEVGVLEEVQRQGPVVVRHARIRTPDRERTFALPRPGLGMSRPVLDNILASHPQVQRGSVLTVEPEGEEFCVELEDRRIRARVVIDATGKLSRLTPERTTSSQFGVQFYEPQAMEDVIDFWFFPDGYGGTVGVEDGRSNSCFLINKDALPRYLQHSGCQVTGPVSYDVKPSRFLAIGDAAGMIDPFCGEGMRHALDTGLLAARIVAEGLQKAASYADIQHSYEAARQQRWGHKRQLSGVLRRLLRYPRMISRIPRPEWWLQQLWG